ncbi:ferric reductase-like transmembrane domain-containing protein [Croceitalea sp. P059]|uniref:ferric reductase-like transmembrane domain-containing protein n=1 Tax=Croceitalea sp. P059 TaxID=3075601 RepID=UPI0028885573|nr:ferric reductase-like transmembrane domain-containing protein [Croceitalea sp. P059]MDT0539735.1 ferric reductase [Croceitalea sp. P059]
MNLIKKNYGWVLVVILASLPLLILSSMVSISVIEGTLKLTLIENQAASNSDTLEMLYHITGEFAIRWMTAVLTCTPFFILFGVTNLYVRQAMGIATAVWSLLHFIIFIWAAGMLETFTQFNYIAGFIAVLILIPLLFTSNRKSMKMLKKNWKKLQSFSYVAIFLTLVHVAILEKTWTIYATIVGVGFIIRIPFIKEKFIRLRTNKNNSN